MTFKVFWGHTTYWEWYASPWEEGGLAHDRAQGGDLDTMDERVGMRLQASGPRLDPNPATPLSSCVALGK